MNYKIGIIGAGKIVEYQHIPILKKMINVNISWIYDIDSHQAKKITYLYNIPFVQKEDLINEIRDLDICLIATPVNTREEYLKICAKFNVAVYCEKPFAISLNKHIEYCSWFKDYNLCVGFQRRNYCNIEILKEVIKSSQYGAIKNIKISQGGYNLKGVNSFVTNSSLYGGMIIESAIHLIDQIIYACNIEDVSIQNVSGILSDNLDYETKSFGLLYSRNQIIPIQMEFSILRNLIDGIEIEFENVTLYVDLIPENYILVKCSKNRNFKLTMENENANNVNQSFFLFWQSFLNAINTKTANYTSASRSLATTKTVSLIYSKLIKNDI